MKRFFAWAVVLSLLLPLAARAEGPEDMYVSIYSLIQDADALNDQGQVPQAVAKYTEAQTALKQLRSNYPDWHVEIVKFRTDYVTGKIAELRARPPVTPGTPASVTPPASSPSSTAATPSAAAPKPAAEVDDAGRNLAEQVARLTADKALLEAKLKEALAAQPAAVDPRELAKAREDLKNLQKENELLQVSLAQARTNAVREASPSGSRPVTKAGEAGRQLAEAQAQIAMLRADRDALRLEKTALESRLVSKSPGAAVTGAVDDQSASLRARLAVLEAQKAPYTTEELALFKKPEAKLAAGGQKRSLKDLPPAGQTLASEANRFFVARQYDKAEERYLQVLKMDEQNNFTLGNLAAIQLELGKLDEAEKHLKTALALDPNDAYCLSILGRLKDEQGKYDEAFELLSRAAELDPQRAEIQNYLGLTLNHKGLRGPAEAVLRKALQIEPNYADAHNNLAAMYLTQKPPLVELARWHYQKARAAGHPVNPELEKMLENAKP